jgi:trans-aconitate 2-methyltransferase
MSWQSERYLQFAGERTRPAEELASRIPLEQADHVADLGCGPGNSTRILRARFPHAALTGIDSAPDMLNKARSSGLDATWVEADASEWAPEQELDVLFSNALLQWIDDHETVFPRLIGMVRPGGVLAVQMPQNFAAPSHELLRETAREDRFRKTLEPLLRTDPVGTAEYYTSILEPHAEGMDIWETTYVQRLSGDDPVLDWVRGTALVPILGALGRLDANAFLDAYGQKLRRAYPRRPNGVTLFPFKRLFIVARR